MTTFNKAGEHVGPEIRIEDPPLPSGQCCGKCDHYYRVKSECRRNPPQIIAIHALGEVEDRDVRLAQIVIKPQLLCRAQGFFPMMKPEDPGCGEFNYRKEEEV